jgi:hypothetical protein
VGPFKNKLKEIFYPSMTHQMKRRGWDTISGPFFFLSNLVWALCRRRRESASIKRCRAGNVSIPALFARQRYDDSTSSMNLEMIYAT